MVNKKNNEIEVGIMAQNCNIPSKQGIYMHLLPQEDMSA